MIKFLFKLFIASVCTYSFIFAQDINLVQGYQLKGAIDNIDPTKFNNSCAKYIFKFDNTTKSWKAHIANDEDYSYTGEIIENIKRTEGFWVMGDTPCDVKVNDKEVTIRQDGTPYIITSDKLNIVENEQEIIFLLSNGSKSNLQNPYKYKIVGGSEHRFFLVDGNSGLLTFKEKPDFENPQDSDKNNIYNVDVEVSDGILSSRKSFFVTVIDEVNDIFKIISKPLIYQSASTNYIYNIITQNAKGTVKYFDATITYPYVDDTYPGMISTFSIDDNRIDEKIFGPNDDRYKYNTVPYLDFTFSCEDETNAVLTQSFRVNLNSSAKPTIDDISMEFRSNELTKMLLSGNYENNTTIPTNYDIVSYPTNGTLIQKDDGTWWYRSNFNYIGTDSFTYTGKIGTYASSIGTVTLDILNSNRKPEVIDQNITLDEDTELTINLTGYDYEQDFLTYSIVNDSVKNGVLTKVDNTTYKYMPKKDFVGSESIAYTVNDGTSTSHEAKLNITIVNVNDRPIIKDMSHTIDAKFIQMNTMEDSVLFNQNSLLVRQSTNTLDVDGDELTFIIVSLPKYGKVKIHKYGGYVYIPNRGYVGTDSFSYKAYDGKLYSNISTVNIDIKAIQSKNRKIPTTGSTYSLNPLDDGTIKRGTPKNLLRDDDGFVIDYVTELMWMDTGDNLVDNETLYTQTMKYTGEETLPQSIKFDIKKVSYTQAESYCASLSLGGYNDWRIPKRLEVDTLIDYSKEEDIGYDVSMGVTVWRVGKARLPDNSFKYATHPILRTISMDNRRFYIDVKHLDGTREVEYLSKKGIYSMNFDGNIAHTSENQGFMCVRGSYTIEPVLYENKTNEILLDTTTNQMWHHTNEIKSLKTSTISSEIISDEPNNKAHNSDAKIMETQWAVPFVGGLDELIDYCSVSTVGGYTDWVLPNINEIKSLDSDSKFTSKFLESITWASQIEDDTIRESVMINQSSVFSSTLHNPYRIEYDPYKYISYDNNKTFVAGLDLPLYQNDKYEEIFKSADIGTDIIVNGVNFKECLPHRPEFEKYVLSQMMIYKGEEKYADCLDAYSKACLYDGSAHAGCKVLTKADLSKPIYSPRSVDLGQGDIDPNSNTDATTRCVRKASDDEVTTFFDKITQTELEIAPNSKQYYFNENSNTFTNTVTGEVFTRIIDNGDGTLTDKMTGIDFPKNILETIPKDINNQDTKYTWLEAKAKVAQMNKDNYRGGNWRLPRQEDETLIDLISYPWYGYTDYQNSDFVKDSIEGTISIGRNAWLQREDDFNSTKAFHTEFCSDAYCTSDKADKRALAVVRSDVIDANIDSSVQWIKSTETFTLQAPNSYLGFEENESKVKYKWEHLSRNTKDDVGLFDNIVIQNATSPVATVEFPSVNNTYERRFKLTLTRDESDLISTDIVRVYVVNKDIIKLNENGTELPYDAKQWSCVKDVRNNLIWESKNDDNTSTSFKDKLFNYGDALIHAESSNLCGVTNWRVPTQQEFNEAKVNPDLINYAGTVRSKRWSIQTILKDRYWTTFDEITLPMVDTNNDNIHDFVWTSSSCDFDSRGFKWNVPFNKSEPLSEDNNTTTVNFALYATTPRVETHRIWMVSSY